MFERVLFTVLCLILISLLRKYLKSNDDIIHGIKGPTFLEILGHVIKSGAGINKILTYLYNIQAKYGPTFCIHVKPFSRILVTSDHNYFGQILASKEYLHRSSNIDIFKSAFGESIFLTKQIDIWRNDRKILNEAFGHESFKMVLENLDQKLSDSLFLENLNGPIDMQEVLHKFIFHTTIESLTDPNAALDYNRTTEFGKALNDYMTNVIKQSFGLGFLLGLTRKRQQEIIKVIRQYGVDMVDAHLQNKNRQTDTNNIIYRMYDAGIPYDRIVDNALLFIEAAHDTVATALAFTLFEIAKNHHVQNKMCAEIDSIIGKNPNATISSGDIQNMKYIHCVVKEGLRMHPTLSFVSRKLHKPAVVDNVTIPADTLILFFIDSLQKSERYYKDPLVFNPDRFNAENKPNLVPNSWAPFALGIRNCIGMPLAMQKMKLILAKLVRKFEFSPVIPEHKPDIRVAFVMKSFNGVPVLVKVRG